MSLRLREQTISRKTENTAFRCAYCGAHVLPVTTGSYRNHCPSCLWSRHVDDRPGDRLAGCGGLMEPVALDFRSGKGLMLVHRCVRCGLRRANRAASNDRRQPDELAAIAAMTAPPAW